MNAQIVWIVAIAAVVAFAPAEARTPKYQQQQQTQQEPDESQLVEHGKYTNKKGESVHSPAHTRDGKAPQGASAKCRDGTYSFSHSRSGTCSRHGGVASWL